MNMGNTKSKYSGCGITTLIFAIIAIICIVADVFDNLLVFFGFIIVGIIIDLLISIITDPKRKNSDNFISEKIISQTEKKINNTDLQENVLDVQGLELQKHISEDFFYNVDNITNELLNIFRKLEKDEEFHKTIKEKKYSWKINGSILDMSYDIHADTTATSGLPKGTKSTITEKIRALFLADLVRCYLNLNYSTDFDTIQGFGLLIFLEKTTNSQINDSNNLDKIIRYRKQINNLFLRQIESCKETDSSAILDTRFFISEIFRGYNPDLQQSYTKLMYCFCEAISNTIDSKSDENSQKWLSEIDSVYNYFDKLYSTKNKIFHFEKDPLLEDVMRYVQKNYKVFPDALTSNIPSRFSADYKRINKIKEQLIEMGIIHKGGQYSFGSNIILIKSPMALERFFKTMEFLPNSQCKIDDIPENQTKKY